MGLLDWLLRPFKKSTSNVDTPAKDEADFFGDEPKKAPAPGKGAEKTKAEPARKAQEPPKRAPPKAKPPKPVKAPKPRAPKPSTPRPEPAPAAPVSEVLSAEEAERRYGALARTPPPPRRRPCER